jgi:hypothetical protein
MLGQPFDDAVPLLQTHCRTAIAMFLTITSP